MEGRKERRDREGREEVRKLLTKVRKLLSLFDF